MRKVGVILVVILLVGLTAGCIGGKTPTGTSSVSSNGISSSAFPKVSIQPKHYSGDELLKNLRSIKQFSFLENTSMSLNVTAKEGNLTEKEKVTIVYRKRGYLDLADKKAEVNITMITFPGGASTVTSEIIVGNDVYVFMGGRWLKLTNETFDISPRLILNLTWGYNIVSLTGRYLQRKPFKRTFENGTQFLYYNVTEADLRTISEAFIRGVNVTFNVTNGVLELRFRDGILMGGRMGYHMGIHIWEEHLGKFVSVYEVGHVYDEFIVFDINIKKPVKIPELGHV
ncbi:hypothetical protein [Thermococcus sp.]|uniref:hypothetical protein n=1 Tax=Thermococcus sp. TaxID=35749 RepID=UPI0025F796F9|nr:hypothetical protein [Thermococcus sp.]